VPELEAGEVGVWCRQTASLALADVERMTGILSLDERRRQDRFFFDRDRRDYAAAHAMLREALSSCDHKAPEDWRFEPDALGKPRIRPQDPAAVPLAFNLSHTQGLVACAVARGTEVGVDVERIDRGLSAEAVAHYFAASEICFLEACAPIDYATRFIELWTLKEAYIKAIGAGLHVPLDSFAFGFEGRSEIRFSGPPGSPSCEFLLAAPSVDTRLAVAVVSTGSFAPWRFSFKSVDAVDGPRPQSLRWSRKIP
jgi:4'-phosphopantetheinyl transferase